VNKGEEAEAVAEVAENMRPGEARSKASRTPYSWRSRSARVRDARLRTNIGNVSTLDDAVAAFNPLCACPIPNASRLASQAR
jgi:hypothetical protein